MLGLTRKGGGAGREAGTPETDGGGGRGTEAEDRKGAPKFARDDASEPKFAEDDAWEPKFAGEDAGNPKSDFAVLFDDFFRLLCAEVSVLGGEAPCIVIIFH